MMLCQSLSLRKEFLGCRDDDDHVIALIRVEILIGYVIYVLRFREGIRCKYWCFLGIAKGKRDIVEACGTAGKHLNSDAVVLLYVAYIVCSDHFVALVMVIQNDVMRADDAVVEAYLHS